jgi:catechol 2,3-dioxygenase-like lactoylglutathione lyase family enzyme
MTTTTADVTTTDLYSVIGVAQLDRSLRWYQAIFGRSADVLIGEDTGGNWRARLGGPRSQAGPGRQRRWRMMTHGVADLDRILDRLAAAGIAHETVETYGNGVRHVVIEDPDGNEFSSAQAP